SGGAAEVARLAIGVDEERHADEGRRTASRQEPASDGQYTVFANLRCRRFAAGGGVINQHPRGAGGRELRVGEIVDQERIVARAGVMRHEKQGQRCEGEAERREEASGHGKASSGVGWKAMRIPEMGGECTVLSA